MSHGNPKAGAPKCIQLTHQVFKFGYQDSSNPVKKEGMPWGCVAHAAGVLDGILKFFYARLAEERELCIATHVLGWLEKSKNIAVARSL